MNKSSDYSVEDTARWLAIEFPGLAEETKGLVWAIYKELLRAYENGRADGLSTAAEIVLADMRKERGTFDERLLVRSRIAPALHEFITGYFDDAGVPECRIREIEEFANLVKKKDIRDALKLIRAEHGDLCLRREFWT